MSSARAIDNMTADEVASLLRKKDKALEAQAHELAEIKRQLDWFKRQLFGRKSEQRLVESPDQLRLTDLFPPPDAATAPPPAVVDVPSHKRRKQAHAGQPADSSLRFDAREVPVQEVRASVPELEGPERDHYEVIREEVTYRLAQRPGSYIVLKHIRPVLKRKADAKLLTVPAPAQVFEKSIADVSFVAGMLVDKFIYHMPLYRQHQRLAASHIEVNRATLTHLVEKAALLLEPIAAAVLRSVLESQVLAMDETSIRAGRKKAADARRGQMKTGYYWPLYGDRDEVYFSFSPSRGTQHVMTLLKGFAGTLLTDGYAAYDRFADRQDAVIHAACWSHTRRYFERALEAEPALAHQGLDFIAALYAHERIIRNKDLDDEKRRDYRSRHHRDAIDAFFLWCRDQLQRPDLIIEGSPLIKAVRYAQNHEAGLRVCLENPAVPLDTNHLERALRAIPMGRKAWLFCWTEVGAQYVGTLQTLLVTCRLHGVDPFTYLVDVLQRVGQHPASRVSELIPRVWKEKFADDPLRSYVDR